MTINDLFHPWVFAAFCVGLVIGFLLGGLVLTLILKHRIGK